MPIKEEKKIFTRSKILTKQNYFGLLISFISIFVFSYLNCAFYAKNIARVGLELCLADFLVRGKESLFFYLFLIPCFLILLQKKLGYMDNIQYILRCFSRRIYLFKQLFFLIILSLIISLYYLICTILTGSFFSSSLLNWNLASSIFYMQTENVYNTSFFNVIALFFLIVFFVLLSVGIFYILLKLLLHNTIICWTVLFCILFLDYTFFRNYISNISMDYLNWLEKDLLINLLIVGVENILFIILCFKLIYKKDFRE